MVKDFKLVLLFFSKECNSNSRLFDYPKGQIISKGLFVSSNSPKKWTNQFIFTTTTNSFIFWKNSRIPKSPFEIICHWFLYVFTNVVLKGRKFKTVIFNTNITLLLSKLLMFLSSIHILLCFHILRLGRDVVLQFGSLSTKAYCLRKFAKIRSNCCKLG